MEFTCRQLPCRQFAVSLRVGRKRLLLFACTVACVAAAARDTTPRAGVYFELPELGLVMRWIPPSVAQLGSPDAEPSRGVDEGPVTSVRLTKGYWMGETEVTQRQWYVIMGTRPSRFQGDNLPVERVSWEEAMEFAGRITHRERAAGRLPDQYVFSLPSEAQWEHAARGGAIGVFDSNVDAFAWHDQNSDRTQVVATKRANIFGLHDMLGNVWEWCSDWYGPYPGGSAADYTGPADGFARASRGGSWWAGPRGARPSNRYRDDQTNRNDDLGFRLALVPADDIANKVTESLNP